MTRSTSNPIIPKPKHNPRMIKLILNSVNWFTKNISQNKKKMNYGEQKSVAKRQSYKIQKERLSRELPLSVPPELIKF
jgi:hypothetical protein